MKETRSLSLSIYEFITNWFDVDNINNKALKFFAALLLIPVLLFFAVITLFVEEPLKCIFYLTTLRTTPRKVWIHYKKCWGSLFTGIKQS